MIKITARETGDSRGTGIRFSFDKAIIIFRLSPASRVQFFLSNHSWGFASLHPRLYAATRSAGSEFLDLHQEAFELGRVGVRIDRRRRQLICCIQRSLARVFRNPAIPPVNRHANLEGLLAV